MIAHINETTKEKQSVKEHAENTANLCREFSIKPLKDVLYTIGLLHDIGKYQKEFQEKIVSGKNIQVEHSTCGAKVALTKYSNAIGYLMAYCIAGHHTGIPDGGLKSHSASDTSLAGRMQRTFEDFSAYQEELQIPEIDINEVFQFILLDCEKGRKDMLISKFAFLTRYCFSCLTDADSLDTAEFCRDKNIDQTVTEFEKIFSKDAQILRHQSTFSYDKEDISEDCELPQTVKVCGFC